MPTIQKSKRPAFIPPSTPPERATGNQDFYNSQVWRATSKMYREANPLCENCMDKHRLNASAVTDHIVPMPEGQAYDTRNFMALCHICHNQKSGKEGHLGCLVAHSGGIPADREEIFKILS